MGRLTEAETLTQETAKHYETMPLAADIMVFSAIGFCLIYLFMTILKLKSQNSALHIKVASLETKMEAKLDSVIKSLVEIKEDLALFKKAEIEVLKELVKPRK